MADAGNRRHEHHGGGKLAGEPLRVVAGTARHTHMLAGRVALGGRIERAHQTLVPLAGGRLRDQRGLELAGGAPPRHRGGAGVVLLTRHRYAVLPDRHDRRDDADALLLAFERSALLDVRFEEAVVTLRLDDETRTARIAGRCQRLAHWGA